MHLLHLPGPNGPLEGVALVPPDARDLVILVPGSGPTDRDGNSPQGLATNTYKLLAEGLCAAGIASLRVDKRGLFGSSGAVTDANAVTLSDYAQDLRGWVALAHTHAPRIWIAGHSEGGLVALAAAERGSGAAVAGLILLAAPGRPLGDVVLEQLAQTDPSLAATAKGILDTLKTGKVPDTGPLPGPLATLFAPGLHGYWRDLLAQDPVALARGWSGPALIVHGDADRQVTSQDAALLAQAMPHATRLALPSATHMLKADQPGKPIATYRDPTLPLHPALLPGIIAFIGESTPCS